MPSSYDRLNDVQDKDQRTAPPRSVAGHAGHPCRAPYRRQGLAGAITAEITRRLFTTGAEIAWLEASGEESWRVYERVGYRPAGQRLYIALN